MYLRFCENTNSKSSSVEPTNLQLVFHFPFFTKTNKTQQKNTAEPFREEKKKRREEKKKRRRGEKKRREEEKKRREEEKRNAKKDSEG